MASTTGSREQIATGVAAGRKFVLVTHSLTDNVEKQIDFLIATILEKYGRASLQAALYSCVKEVVVNATKANAKKVFFEEQGLKFNEREDYIEGMKRLKKLLSESWIQEYGRKAKQRGMEVSIAFVHNSDGMRIEVRNDADILPTDEERIRMKLAEGTTYDDLATFYMKNVDNTEGEGLGLVMNLVLLKAENINPALFRVGMVDGKSLARIEIPFSENFKSVRGINPDGFVRDDDIGLELDFRSES
jgi:hypothetical protein